MASMICFSHTQGTDEVLTRIAKLIVVLVLLIILLLVGLYIWRNNDDVSQLISLIASITSFLTATATLFFGLYQVSKDERKVEFDFLSNHMIQMVKVF